MSDLPRKTVMLRVDYGKPEWRDPAPGETPNARAGGQQRPHHPRHGLLRLRRRRG